MLQQAGLGLVQRLQQGLTIRGAGQDHHQQATAEDADDHLAHPRLGNIEDVVGIRHVDTREGDDGGGVARQRKGVGDVVLMVVGDVGAQRQPERDEEAEQPGIADAKAGDHHRRHGTDEAAHHPPQTLADDAAHSGKLTTAAEVIAQ